MIWRYITASLAGVLCIPTALCKGQDTQPATQDVKYECLDVVVSPATFGRMSDLLGLEGERFLLAQSLFVEYQSAAARLEVESLENVRAAGLEEADRLKAEWKEKEKAATSARDVERLRTEYSGRIRAALQNQKHAIDTATREARLKGDAQLREWRAALSEAVGIDGEMDAHVDRLILRRADGRERPDGMRDDFSNPPDLFDVCDAAGVEGGELHDVLGGGSALSLLSVEEKVEGLAGRIRAALERYEAETDVIVSEVIAKRRRPAEKNVRMSVPQGDPEFEEEMKANAREWGRRFDAYAKPAGEIAQALSDAGREADAKRWRWRVTGAVSPELTKARWPSRMMEWLDGQGGAVTSEERDGVRSIYEEYMRRFEEAVERAMRAGVKLKREQWIVDLMQTTELDLAYGRARLEIHRVGREAVERLAGVLGPELVEKLKQEACGGRRYEPSLLGPRIDPVVLRVVDEAGMYRRGPKLCEEWNPG